MSNIAVEGMEELQEFIEHSNLTDSQLKNHMNKALKPLYEKVKTNAPVSTGALQSGFKKTVKNEGLAVVGIIKSSSWYDIFTEYGTSYDRSHVGWFERIISSGTNNVIKELSEVVEK